MLKDEKNYLKDEISHNNGCKRGECFRKSKKIKWLWFIKRSSELSQETFGRGSNS